MKMSTIIALFFFVLACGLSAVCDLIYVHFWAVNAVRRFPLGLSVTFGLTLLFLLTAIIAVTLVFWFSIKHLIIEEVEQK